MPATFTVHSQHEAFDSLQNLAYGIEGFAVRIAADLRALDRFEGLTPTGPEWLVQVIQEAIREQYADAIKAARELTDEDPLKVSLPGVVQERRAA